MAFLHYIHAGGDATTDYVLCVRRSIQNVLCGDEGTHELHTLILLCFLPSSGTNAMYANHVSAYYVGLISI